MCQIELVCLLYNRIKKLSSVAHCMGVICYMNLKPHVLSGFISKLLFSGAVFLVNVLVARVAGATNSGSFFYAVNNLSFLVLISSFSLEAGIVYYSSKEQITATDAAAFSITWALIAALLFSVFMLAIPGFLAGFGNAISVSPFLFLSGNLLIGFFSGLFFAQKQFGLPQLVAAVGNLPVIFYCTLILMNNRTADLKILVWIYTGSYLLTGLVLAGLFFKKNRIYQFSLSAFVRSYKLIARYSWLAFVANIAAFLMFRVDYWILALYSPRQVSTADIGNYIQVAKLVQLFLFVPMVFATVIFPFTASQPAAGNHQQVRRIISRITIMNVSVVGVLWLAGSGPFIFLFGPDFDKMYFCFLYLAPGAIAISNVTVFASYFAGLNKVSLNIAGAVLAFGLITLFNFLLIPQLGINGAALADSIGYAAYLLFHVYHFNKTAGRA